MKITQKRLKWSDLFFENSLRCLLLAYLVSTAILELPLYPAWQHRIQLPEVIFLLICSTIILGFVTQKISFPVSWSGLDIAVAVYFAVNVISAIIHPGPVVLLEILGTGYLVVVYFVFRLAILEQWITWKKIIVGVSILTVMMIVLTFLGYSFLFLGYDNNLVIQFLNYPYFGTLYRAKATLQTPSMYISMINWCFLFILIDGYWSGWNFRNKILIFGLIACAILSFAKGVLLTLTIACLLMVIRFWTNWRKRGIATILLFTGTVYFMLTNLVYIGGQTGTTVGAGYLGQAPPNAVSTVDWIPSSYWAIKKSAWQMGVSHPILGVGPGNFNKELKVLQERGEFPEHLPLYDPHSVWLGAFAETGIVGLSAVALIFLIGIQTIWNLDDQNPLVACLVVWLIVFTIEGLNGDLMNFRHYWIQLGFMGGLVLASTRVRR